MQTIARYDSATQKVQLQPSVNFSSHLDQAKTAGCLIHSDSWGTPSPGLQLGYDNYANEIDTFTNKYQEFLAVFAAGNQGYDDVANAYRGAQVGGPSIAKNALTVGATLSPKSTVNTNVYDANALADPNLLGNLLTVATYRCVYPCMLRCCELTMMCSVRLARLLQWLGVPRCLVGSNPMW